MAAAASVESSLAVHDTGPSAGTEIANPALFRLLSDPDRVRRSTAAQAGRTVLAPAVAFRAIAPTLEQLTDSERRLLDEWLHVIT